ncbi:MAG: hypothetical protein M3377_10170, partial [Actinomycetota bacterium]|nr:hypothetical protein [Actinomycetota bacterium]
SGSLRVARSTRHAGGSAQRRRSTRAAMDEREEGHVLRALRKAAIGGHENRTGRFYEGEVAAIVGGDRSQPFSQVKAQRRRPR